MKIPDPIDRLPTNGTRSRVYGDPYRTADGAPVSKVRAGSATPIGVFVIQGGTMQWVAAVDADRIALIGVIAAVLGSVALLRRPPWPDLSATSAAWARPTGGRLRRPPAGRIPAASRRSANGGAAWP